MRHPIEIFPLLTQQYDTGCYDSMDFTDELDDADMEYIIGAYSALTTSSDDIIMENMNMTMHNAISDSDSSLKCAISEQNPPHALKNQDNQCLFFDNTVICDEDVTIRVEQSHGFESNYCDGVNNEMKPASEAQIYSTPIKAKSFVPVAKHDYMLWKTRIWTPYSYLLKHPYASLFQQRVADDSENLSQTMNLKTLRKSIQRGFVQSTNEFKHRITLMCYYALFYYEDDKHKCEMVRMLLDDVISFTDSIMEGS